MHRNSLRQTLYSKSTMPTRLVLFAFALFYTPYTTGIVQAQPNEISTQSDTPAADVQTSAPQANSTPEPPAIIDTLWVLRFEQAYGIPGLYVVEPPAEEGDTNAVIRRELVTLTQQAWRFLQEHPNDTPTLEALLEKGYIESLPNLAAEAEFKWSDEAKSFVSNRGNEGNLIYGAFQQLKQAEEYRKRVTLGDQDSFDKLVALSERLQVPELIQQEVQARMFTKQQLEQHQVKLLQKVQQLLAQLSAAIQKGNEYGYFPEDQPLTMKLIGEFGLIDSLEALPNGGEYLLGKPNELPRAQYGERIISLSPAELPALLLRNVTVILQANPNFPPALALRARYSPPEQAWADINRAIELWPDCPAFRVQRTAMGFDAENTTYFQQDLDYLFSRFPSAPILLELTTASAGSQNPILQEWHRGIVEKTVEVRPEVLNLQLIRFKLAQDEQRQAAAAASWEYIIRRHPGYAPLLILPKKTTTAESLQSPESPSTSE
ncbi:MAG: hypothetical protein ACFCU1_01110 [Sumerlaeia bacterium]